MLTMKDNKILTIEIEQIADQSMIDIIGVTHAAPFSTYLLKNSPRIDPGKALTGAKSIIVAGIYIGGLTMPEWGRPGLWTEQPPLPFRFLS